MEKDSKTTVAVERTTFTKLDRLAKANNVSKMEFLTHAINYFEKYGINPVEHESPAQEMQKLIKRMDQVFAFLKKQETDLVRPPYGITSDIFKILMFESLGNFLGGSIVLQLEPTQKLFSRKLYNPYTVFYHTFFDLKLVYEVGPESFLPPPTVKSALLNIKRKHLFFDFKFKAKYLAFISCLLEKPDLSVKTALKSIFRKSQVRSISEKFGLNLNAQIVCLSPSQWLNCFLEMLEVVPEKFHPS